MRKQKRNHKRLITHMIFAYLMLFCTLTGFFACVGDGHAHVETAEAATGTCPMEGYDTLSGKVSSGMSYLGGTLTSRATNSERMSFPISVFGNKVPKAGESYPASSLLNKAAAYFNFNTYEKLSCSFCGTAHTKENGNATYYFCNKEELDKNVIVWGVTYNSSDDTFTLGTVATGSSYITTYYGSNYIMAPTATGTHTYSTSHTCTSECKERLHTHVDSFDETVHTYTCECTDTWYQKFYENSSNTQQSCGHYGNPYIAEHYCSMCGEAVYVEYMEGCNTTSCSNYLHPAPESSSHPGTHTYKHTGVRYECTYTGEIVDREIYSGAIDHRHHCAKCGYLFYDEISGTGYTTDYSCGMPSKHYYYVKEAAPDSCYSYSDICTGGSVQTNYTNYYEYCTCSHWNSDYTSSVDYNFQATGFKYTCKTCKMLYLDRITYAHKPDGTNNCSFWSPWTDITLGSHSTNNPRISFIGIPNYAQINYVSGSVTDYFNYNAKHRTQTFHCTKAEYGDYVCDQVVTALLPLEPEQEIGAGESINAKAYARFLNGTIAEVTCQVVGLDNTKYNEWQTITLAYGTYSSVGNKTPRTATIRVYVERINFDVTATVSDEEMGSVTGGGSYTVGTEVTVVATPANGYRFMGWFKNGTTYVSGNTSYTFTMPNENVSLVASFTTNMYSLSVSSESETKGTVVNNNSPSVDYKSSVTVGAVPRAGFSFAGWYEGGTLKSSNASYTFNMPAQNLSLVAKFNLASYTVSFNSNGGSACSAITVSYLGAYGTLPTPTKSGYIFAGWRYNGLAVTSATPVTAAGNHTLTAAWAPAGPAFIMVTYGLPYGNNSWSRENTNIGSFGLTASNLQAWLPYPSKTGYNFNGWYRTENSAGNGNDLGKPAENTVTKDTLVNIKGQHTLHAGWTEKTFTLSFDSNGGTACSDMTITYDRKYNHNQNLPRPTKSGYVFGGWYTSEIDNNGCGTVIGNEDRVQVTENQKLYAKWNAEGGGGGGTKTVTVTYMPGGTKLSYTYPGKYNPTASAPVKTGYNFAGYWMYGNTQIKPDGSTSLQEEFDHTVTAAFNPKTPSIKLDQQGATTTGTTSVTATYDVKIPNIPVLPKKTGYTFGGYYTGTGGTGDMYYDAAGRSDLICQFENDITLYAYWIKQKVITYYPNGGSGSMAPTYVEHGSTSALIKSNGFTVPAGHEFISWNTKADGSGDTYIPGTYVSNITSDLALYAQWRERKNTITYEPNGGEGYMPVTELAYNVTATTLPKNTFTRNGHNFIGWATTPGRAVVYADRASVTVSGNIILYAKWQEKTVNYDLVYYKYPYGSADTTVWQRINGISYKTAVTILGAPYTPKPYAVTYYINKPSGMSSVPATLNLTGKNTATGIAEFVHWELYRADAGTYQYEADYLPNSGPYTALSDTNGEVLYMYPVWAGADASVILPSTSSEGYVFKGWSESQNGSTAIYVPKTPENDEVSGTFTPTKDTKFYGQWEPAVYQIYFDYQKPAASTPEMTGNETESKNVTFDAVVGTLPAPEISGWKFEGWFTEINGKGAKITSATKWTYAENITLYAHWTANTYTVTLEPDGGQPTPAPTVKPTYDANMPSINVPTRKYTVTFNANTGTCATTSLVSEYTFGGYFSGKDGTGTQYYKADGTSARAWNVAQNTTLYAKWTSASVTLPTPTKTGYTFQGWYTAASGGTKIGNAGDDYTPTADITLYAQWKAKEYDIILNDRGATSTNHTETVHMVYDEKGKDIITPTKTGYIFQGYYTGIRGAGKIYYGGKGICVTEWKEESVTELFAYWIQDEVLVPEEDDISEPTPLPEQDMEGNVGRNDAKCLLYADDYDDATDALTDLQPYLVYDTDASKGVIPGTEKLSFRAKMGEWMLHYKLHRNTGTDYVRFYVTVPYRTQYERSEDEELVISARQNKTYTFLISKVWNYWEIIESGMYYPEKVTVTSQAIKNMSVVIPVKRDSIPSGVVPYYDVKQYGDKTAHVFWEKYDTDGYPVLDITLTEEQYIISDVLDTLPDIDAVLEGMCRKTALTDTRQARVRSDRFMLDGNVILSDGFSETGSGAELGKEAAESFANSGKIAETSYQQAYMSGIELDEEKTNGEYETSAEIVYIGDESNINAPETVTVELTDMNPIRIHTPVVCRGQIEDGMESTEEGYVLALKEAFNFFTLSVDNTGTHRMSFGYGTKNYVFALSGKSNVARQNGSFLNQVQFPFDVYVDVENDSKQADGSLITDGDFLLPTGTWFTVGTTKHRFYVPVTMKNGEYQIKFRSVAVNCPKDDVGQFIFGEEEYRANLSPSCYVAADVIEVEVRSYLRDFRITSANDPLAAEQFEKGCQALTLKKGYGFSFELLTQGEFYGDGAAINIVPRFFWESGDGTNRREVKLYHVGELPKDFRKICYAWEDEPVLRQHEKYEVILQSFIGNGFIPADILCVAKEFPLEEYAEKNTFSGREEFFFRDGYLIIHFDISVKSNEGVVYYFDKWQETELFEDAKKEGWSYISGDIIRYDLSKSIADDYEIGGSE